MYVCTVGDKFHPAVLTPKNTPSRVLGEIKAAVGPEDSSCTSGEREHG